MTASSHRKQILLFLAAVVLPSMALTFLTLQIIRQEKELAAKRLQEERGRRAREVGQVLLARLETIKRDEVQQQIRCNPAVPCGYVHPETRMIAVEKDGRLILPWELGPAMAAAAGLEPATAALVYKAAAAESKDLAKSVQVYRSAISSTAHPAWKQRLRLELALVLRKAGQSQEAGAIYRELASLPMDIRDEDGIPLCLYACEALLNQGVQYQEILSILAGILSSPEWKQPLVYYRLRDLAEKLLAQAPGTDVRNAVEKSLIGVRRRIQDVEDASELQRNLASIDPLQNAGGTSAEPRWAMMSAGRWFVGRAQGAGNARTFIIAVGVDSMLQRLRGPIGSDRGDLHFVSASDPNGETLGFAFPDSRIVLGQKRVAAESDFGGTRSYPYVWALLLVLGITLFGGYLLWRDVRREVRLAALRSQFVAGVSHELKTPLTSIRMFADTLRLGRLKSQKTQEEYLDTIVNESERLSRLLNNVLDFSRIEEGRMVYQFGPVTIPDVVGAAAKAMSYPLEQMGFTLAISLEDGLPEIQADRDALIQALLNLLHNAMKFSGASRRIELSAVRGETGITIRVADHGIGIDAAEHKKIFERFYRAPSSNPERIPGTGLGLTIVSHIVNAHRGAVEVESAPGRGSTFSITLPLGSQS
jgi:signal transduction histidine kinase